MEQNDFDKNVFINCPFDSHYLPLLRALIFVVLYLGYNPKIASERSDSGEIRINKIVSFIEQSRLSIHDLSRIKSSSKNEYYRMNMPFELGVDYGCRCFKSGTAKNKLCLILEKEKYGYQAALSDIAGFDIKSHKDEPEQLIQEVRDWFRTNVINKADSGTKIWDAYNIFLSHFYETRASEGYSKRDVMSMPILEFVDFVNEWLSSPSTQDLICVSSTSPTPAKDMRQ